MDAPPLIRCPFSNELACSGYPWNGSRGGSNGKTIKGVASIVDCHANRQDDLYGMPCRALFRRQANHGTFFQPEAQPLSSDGHSGPTDRSKPASTDGCASACCVPVRICRRIAWGRERFSSAGSSCRGRAQPTRLATPPRDIRLRSIQAVATKLPAGRPQPQSACAASSLPCWRMIASSRASMIDCITLSTSAMVSSNSKWPVSSVSGCSSPSSNSAHISSA